MEILIETFWDNLKLFPFLFVTYLCLEYMEHKTSEKALSFIKKARSSGPLIGSLCGALPQCGFAAAAANFYAAHIIGIGTLLAVFLSTSDEMLPIMISNAVAPKLIIQLIAYKIICAVIFGYAAYFWTSKYYPRQPIDIEQLCKNENCHCENSIIIPALHHSVKITIFIFIITLILNYAIAAIDINIIAAYLRIPLLGEFLGGVAGLIPNCSSSVILTQLYLDGYINTGSLLSGTLVGGGVGLLVLFRVNRHWRENLKIALLLFCCGILGGLCSYLFF